ncbi:DUF6387 family protein [Oceanisphaera arctica]|uniref:Uncharacterized protein n=1 Tax=Oceanisphaera arctica TaxID=641510 RepID=A0A2P5TN88_9GAMM|nr:DUF6387 family protein [Oceanisphaera arctica]PPL16982.1 hypothetical protein UN63_06560 [Oceanisphaera arctica]GHA07659.1 hypothetical protein GCM10007082_05670 [Oceanisphaera arctica]
MAKRINKPEQLPEWFNLERYEALLSLSVADFIMQMDFRVWAKDPETIKENLIHIADNALAPVAFEGDSGEWKDGVCDLTVGNYASPLSNFHLCLYDAAARKKGAYGEKAEQSASRQFVIEGITLDKAQAFKSVPRPMVDRLPVSLNLEDATDEQIVDELRNLLPLWRKQTNTPEPKPERERAGFSILTRLVEYQAISMMDLMLWEQAEDVRITNELMARVLFPDHSRGGQHIAQTNRPFVAEMMKGDQHEGLLLALEKEPHYYDWTISDFMKWKE